jgi:hypothetical protein
MNKNAYIRVRMTSETKAALDQAVSRHKTTISKLTLTALACMDGSIASAVLATPPPPCRNCGGTGSVGIDMNRGIVLPCPMCYVVQT